MNLTLTAYLGDNCIVFEYFTASIGDLMVANRVYYPSSAILNIKMYYCISLGLNITKIKIPGNIVERLQWHINNVTSYEDFQFKM